MIDAMRAALKELEDVLECINQDKIPFDGDDFHETLRNLRQAIAEAEKEAALQEISDIGQEIEPVACVCGEPMALGIVHRQNAPCFYDTAPFKQGNLCCNDYKNCTQPCTPRGEWLAVQNILITALPKQEIVSSLALLLQ
jgi:hypothetical protein